ncbi:hypothetical protein B296_00015704, partial [Ensete ventricosum]
ILFPTLRIEHFTNPEVSEVGLKGNLDFLEEHKAEGHLKTLRYQKAVARLYNQKVWPQPIGMGDLVLRKAKVSDPRHSREKLAPR